MGVRIIHSLKLIFLLFLLSACSDQGQQDTFKAKTSIAVSATPLSAPFFVAAAKGYFSKHGIDVILKKYQGGHLCLKAVLDGESEFGTASDYPIMLNAFKRNDYKVLVTFVSSYSDVKLLTNRKKISHVSELKSKRIGVVTGGSSHYFLDRFLLFNSLKLGDVSIEHINPEKMPDALQQGQVDAIAVWEPFGYVTSQKLGSDLNIFEADNFYRETFNLVAMKKHGKDKSGVERKVILALQDSIAFIHEHPKEAQSILVKELNLDDKFIDWIWGDFDFRLSLDQALLLTLENESRWAMENKVVKKGALPNYLKYIDTAPLLSIDKSAVGIIQ